MIAVRVLRVFEIMAVSLWDGLRRFIACALKIIRRSRPRLSPAGRWQFSAKIQSTKRTPALNCCHIAVCSAANAIPAYYTDADFPNPTIY